MRKAHEASAQHNYRQVRRAGHREVVFSREENINWLSSATQPENTHRSILQKLNRLYLGVHRCIYTYMHAITISEKRGHDFERQWGRVCGKGGEKKSRKRGREEEEEEEEVVVATEDGKLETFWREDETAWATLVMATEMATGHILCSQEVERRVDKFLVLCLHFLFTNSV